jgi:hypothetical protein
VRTTITVPDQTFAEAKSVAAERNQSVSSLISQFIARGLRQLAGPATIGTDPVTGLPVIITDRVITAEEVEEAIAE